MKNFLIVYATRQGQTEKIAMKIQSHLEESGQSVAIYNAKDVVDLSVEDFDFVVCGGSMHAGGIEKELLKFISSNNEKIKGRKNAFFLTLLSAATKDDKLREEWLAEAQNAMDKQLSVRFSSEEMFAGALMYSKYSWFLKIVMKRIAKKAGEGTDTSRDYEYTDWNHVKEYCDRLIAM